MDNCLLRLMVSNPGVGEGGGPSRGLSICALLVWLPGLWAVAWGPILPTALWVYFSSMGRPWGLAGEGDGPQRGLRLLLWCVSFGT